MRKRLYEVVAVAKPGDRYSAAYDTLSLILIVLSLVPLAFKSEYRVLEILDKSCAVFFSIDYLFRLSTADFNYNETGAWPFFKYPFSFMAIIDLLSILPSFTAVNGSLKVLRVFRMFRALRVLRVFKAARYSRSVQIILGVFRRSKDALSAVCSLAVVYVLISALIILNVEPDSFDSFFDAIYWATVSLTTMGYGDIYPVTTIGRVVTMVSSVFGIAIVALPAGIITAGYLSEIEKENNPVKVRKRGKHTNGRAIRKNHRRRLRKGDPK